MSFPKKVFVVRAKPHGINREEQFLDGTVSIGWPTKESLKGKSRNDVEATLKPDYQDITTVAITQIHNFVNIPVESIIITPSYKNRDIHIFKTKSEYIYVPEWADDEIGNPHTIEVEFIKTVPRNVFSEIVNRSLLAAKRTVTNFTKYTNEIQMIIKSDDMPFNAAEAKIIGVENYAEIEARQTLKELLKSSNEEIRLKAALALLNKD